MHSDLTNEKNMQDSTYTNVEDLFIKDMNLQNSLHGNDDSFMCDHNHRNPQSCYFSSVLQRNPIQNSESQDEKFEFKIQSRGKKIKKNNMCGHPDKEHYAKGMCRSCYSKYGRNKKPWNCQHEKLYAQGLCQLCYANKYNQIKKVEKIRNSSGSSCGEPQ